jgi:hypothetical protein
MNEFLKGNFKTKKQVANLSREGEISLEERFEREALKKLGGSIAFVSKKKVLWDENDFKSGRADE